MVYMVLVTGLFTVTKLTENAHWSTKGLSITEKNTLFCLTIVNSL